MSDGEAAGDSNCEAFDQDDVVDERGGRARWIRARVQHVPSYARRLSAGPPDVDGAAECPPPVSRSRSSLRAKAAEAGIELDAFPVPDSSYGDVVMSLVMAADAARGHIKGVHKRLWICSSFLLFALTFVGQFSLSYALFATAIEQAEDHYENGRAEKMTARLRAAIRANMPLHEEDAAIFLCDRTDITIIPAYFAMLCVWHLRMLDELAQNAWLMMVTQRVPTELDMPNDSESSSDASTPVESMIRTVVADGVKNYQIRHLTPHLKRMCMVVSIPKLAITLWITWVGAKFLVFAHQAKDLILKTLVCSFFVQVETLVYHSLISDAKQRRIKNTTIFFKPVRSEDWSNWGSTLVRIALMLVLVSLCWFVKFGNVRAFRYTCLEYEAAFPKPRAADAGITWLFW